MTLPRDVRDHLRSSPEGLAILSRHENEKKAARLRKARKSAPRRKEKRATKEETNDRTAEIRAACVKRAGGECELCSAPNDDRLPAEMHHLLPGRGRRTQEQAVENCIMVCSMCHAIGHGRILMVADSLIGWARRHGYAETEKAIRYRIDKALLADPTWPRDEDETRRLGPAKETETP